MDERVKKAYDNYKAAAEALITTTREAYPEGTILTVNLGGYEIEVKVIGHTDSWWNEPGEMIGLNL